MAASVMPAASAIRTASAVGADTATISGAPNAAVFCTISTETRLVSSTMPSVAETLSSASAPASLSSALWRPTSPRQATMPPPGIPNPAAWTPPVSLLLRCTRAGPVISLWERSRASPLGGFGRCNPPGVPGLLVIGLLPVGCPVRRPNLHRRDLVFRAVGRPVGILGRDDVGLRVRMVEGGVDHARRDPVGDLCAQGGLAGAAREPDPVAVAHAALLGIVRVDFE